MKFITSTYDKKTGYSTVILEHLGQTFQGNARLHPDDKEKASEFAGCSYAEIRATIKALKYERKIQKEKAEEVRKFIKQCEAYNNWDKESPTARVVYRQMNRYIKRVNELADQINDLAFGLNRAIWNREVTLRAIDRNKTKKLNS